MKVLGALFGTMFLAGVFFLLRRSGAEGGRLEAAFGAGLMAIAVAGWMVQLIVGAVYALFARKRGPRAER